MKNEQKMSDLLLPANQSEEEIGGTGNNSKNTPETPENDEVSVFSCYIKNRDAGTSYNANNYGILPGNGGLANSQILQSLIDRINATGGGTIYIPAGVYRFASTGQHYTKDIYKGDYCVKHKSNVNVVGDGPKTILMPTGNTEKGLCMFMHFTDAKDAKPIENCYFRDFVVDGSNVTINTYETLGKAFMFSPLKNCHWARVMVKNTTATGFGVDNPVNCSFLHCKAYGCGRGASLEEHVGASGFGIGFGFSPDESMTIFGCESYSNFNHGIFFEHQGRFTENVYDATDNYSFHVCNCIAGNNKHNFAAILGNKVFFDNCYSFGARKFGYYLHNSRKCRIKNCESDSETEASFVIKSDSDGDRNIHHPNQYNIIQGCTSMNTPYGLKVVNDDNMVNDDNNSTEDSKMKGNVIRDCNFMYPNSYAVLTAGVMTDLTLTGNEVLGNSGVSFDAQVAAFVNKRNSWNES